MKEETKQKSNKGITLLIIILSLISILSLGYIGYDKVLKNVELKAEKKENSNKLPTTIKDLNKTEVQYLNISDLKKFYFSMENDNFQNVGGMYKNFNDNKIYSNFEYVDYVKVKNSKLFWKVNGNWVQDTKIQGDILYFDLIYPDVGPASECIIYSDKTLYKVDFVMDFDKYVISANDYKDFKYNIIAKNIVIDDIKGKYISGGCVGEDQYFMSINNKIYVINYEHNAYSLIDKNDDYYANISLEFDNCSYERKFSINIDGKVNGVISENGQINPVKNNNITIEHYFIGENYELLIDSNKNYYLYNINATENGSKEEKIDELKPMGKIQNITYDSVAIYITIDDESIKLYNISPWY